MIFYQTRKTSPESHHKSNAIPSAARVRHQQERSTILTVTVN